MKWTYAIRNKLVAAVILTAVIGLVVLNNFNEKRNTEQIRSAINTIYNDRLIADHYIIQYLQHSHHIVEALEDEQLSETARKARIFAILSKVKTLNRAYEKTQLTKSEKIAFGQLAAQYHQLELSLSQNDQAQATTLARTSMKTLAGLSDIQYQEAQQQMTVIDRLNSYSAVLFRFEVGVLIVVILIVQALIFASKSLQVSLPKHPSTLN